MIQFDEHFFVQQGGIKPRRQALDRKTLKDDDDDDDWVVVTHFFLNVSPLYGEMIQIDEHIFSDGWFNHQLGDEKSLLSFNNSTIKICCYKYSIVSPFSKLKYF